MNITEPTLIIDKDKCLRNIDLMLAKTQNSKLILRPHFKTHQSAIIGEWFREKGIDKISVSSMKMAKYFADNGWTDISVCTPVNILEIDIINKLASEISLNILIESVDSISYLHEHLKHNVNVYIKIDTGYNRTGILASEVNDIQVLILNIKSANNLSFKGFLSHSGQNNTSDEETIRDNNKHAILELNELKYTFGKENPDLELSLGDTPSCSICNDFPGIDEIRPGNFVFYDMQQYILGSCEQDQISVVMACPIIAKHKIRNEIVIYGGGIHFSKEYIDADEQGGKLYGSMVKFDGKSWGDIIPGGYLSALSQEHGIIKCNNEVFDNYELGDLVYILPIHSCMTANAMGRYISLDGQTINMMPKF